MQIVAPRSNSAWRKSDGRAWAAGLVAELRRQRAQPGLGCWQFLGDREQSGDDTLDIAIHRDRWQIERDRGDGGGGVIADAGQRAQAGQIAWKAAGCHHRLGAGMQVAGAGVVAEASPGREHRLQRGGSEAGDGGKAG